MKLRISDDLVLSADFVTSTAGIFATKGMGKTHIAQVMAEEMLANGQVVVAIDPTDAWYGLRSSADGRSDGYPILVIGGDHGDLKLEPEPGAGTRLAEAIVAERFSCVICTDGIDDTLAIRYVREVLQTLFRKNKEPIHVFVDEADLFAPQQPKEQEDYRCIRALSHVVRRGRKKGIGTTLITQRPAELNASVRTMVEMLFVLGMLHNLDIDAVEKWLRLRKKKHGDNAAFALQEEMIDSLDSLQCGDAWVWAPRLKIHKRFRAREKRTFDSGATPKPGQKVRAAKRLAPVDIQRLGAAIAEAAQRQKENDPTELRRQVAQLRADLSLARTSKTPAGVPNENKKPPRVVEKLVVKDAQIARVEKLVSRADLILSRQDGAVSRHHQAYAKALEGYTMTSKSVTSAAIAALDDLRKVLGASRWNGLCEAGKHGLDHEGQRCDLCAAEKHVAKAKLGNGFVGTYLAATGYAKTVAPVSKGLTNGSSEVGGMKPAHQRLLSAIAWWESIGVATPDLGGVAFVAKTSTKSSAFDNNRSWLRARGFIDYPSSGRVQLTTLGRAHTPPPALPPTNEALHQTILGEISPAHGRMLRTLIEAYPDEMSLEEFAKRASTSVTSSAFDNNRSWLRARGLAEYPRTGYVRATGLLFPEAM